MCNNRDRQYKNISYRTSLKKTLTSHKLTTVHEVGHWPIILSTTINMMTTSIFMNLGTGSGQLGHTKLMLCFTDYLSSQGDPAGRKK